jgi:hypothetical protein
MARADTPILQRERERRLRIVQVQRETQLRP